jgi:hypothetical protein
MLFEAHIHYVFCLTNNGLGYILSDFFTNLSGHPGRQAIQRLTTCRLSKKFHKLKKTVMSLIALLAWLGFNTF